MRKTIAECYLVGNSPTLGDKEKARFYNRAMTNREIRYRNFMFLFGQFEKDIDFGRAAIMDPRMVYQVKTKRRNIGPDLARHIETSFKLPEGWMDERHDVRDHVVVSDTEPTLQQIMEELRAIREILHTKKPS